MPVILNVDQVKYITSFALQTGTYAYDNYTAETYLIKSIFTVYIGISLNGENYLWLNFNPEARSGKKSPPKVTLYKIRLSQALKKRSGESSIYTKEIENTFEMKMCALN